jgi:single-strand DNA-binding protein
MASINRVTIIGHIGRDPESRAFPDGTAVCNMSVATSETWKDKVTGEKKEATEWHRVSATGKLAEICTQYLRQGSLVYIDGSLRTRKYQKDGGVDHYATEIRADQMRMLDKRQDGQQSAQSPQPRQAPASRQQAPQRAATQAPAPKPGSGFDDMDDDVPF